MIKELWRHKKLEVEEVHSMGISSDASEFRPIFHAILYILSVRQFLKVYKNRHGYCTIKDRFM